MFLETTLDCQESSLSVNRSGLAAVALAQCRLHRQMRDPVWSRGGHNDRCVPQKQSETQIPITGDAIVDMQFADGADHLRRMLPRNNKDSVVWKHYFDFKPKKGTSFNRVTDIRLGDERLLTQKIGAACEFLGVQHFLTSNPQQNVVQRIQ